MSQTFYDDLLKKILALPKLQEIMKGLHEDAEEPLGNFEIEVEALSEFILEGDDKDILAIPEIWRLVQEAIRETTQDLTYNPKTFLEEISSIDGEEIFRKKIEEIHEQLDQALKRKHGREEK